MKYICAQPAIQYFAWQIDVMLHSFKKANINLNDVHIICSTNDGIDPHFKKLKNKYTGVLFSFYEDTRKYKGYIPSIKQHLLYKHYLKYPELENEIIFLVDSDICLIKPIDFSNLLNDNIWYLSDTISYIGYDYIKSKGDDILKPMLEIAGINENIVKSMQNASGGAQYLIKNVNAEYWREVVELSHKLYIDISKISNEKKAKNEDYFPIQIWTAEMWALLWVAWKKGIMTAVAKELDFCWATDNISRWNETSIFHNAGVTEDRKELFYKGKYINNMPDLYLNIDNTKCSYNYYEVLKQALI